MALVHDVFTRFTKSSFLSYSATFAVAGFLLLDTTFVVSNDCVRASECAFLQGHDTPGLDVREEFIRLRSGELQKWFLASAGSSFFFGLDDRRCYVHQRSPF
jgi:hypothetical protein